MTHLKTLLKLFIICISAITFLSCSNDEENENSEKTGNIDFTDGIDLVFVEGGTFTQGSLEIGEAHEKPAHQVTLNDFYIGKYEISQKQWYDVVGSWPELPPEEANGKGDNYPIYYVSWFDAQLFLTKLNEKTGKEYRLPTEAEWEYASKGGKRSKEFLYSGSDTPNDIAIYYGTVGGAYEIGLKGENELGIHDMSGNVWEWTNDWYGPYDSNPQTNPKGSTEGSERVTRGGTWINVPYGIRTTARYKHNPSSTYKFIGFRVAHSEK